MPSALLAVLIAVLLNGCALLEEGVSQEVVILSFPNEASVYINGAAHGITPVTVSLARKGTHEIRLEKQGYNSSVQYFVPVPNEKSENFVRFGLSEDLGYYVDLEPSTMKTELQSGLVPYSIGADPFGRMAQQALEADRKLEAGEITPLEHKFIIEQIIEFFEKNS
jgi:hypothetical protein